MLKSIRLLREALKPSLTQSDLLTILQDMNPENSIDERVLALKNLMSWIRLPVRRQNAENELSHVDSKNIRFKFLIQFFSHHEREKNFFASNLKELLAQGVAVRLYCMTGVAENTGFFSELADRLVLRMLPHVYSERDLAELFKVIFTDEEDAEWFEKSGSIILPPIMEIITQQQIPLEGLSEEINEALIILGAQISSLGVSKGMRRRLRLQSLSDSPFVRLNKIINSATRSNQDILGEVAECQLNLARIRERAEASGVSVDLIYNLERLNALLHRVELLVRILEVNPNEKSPMVSHFMGHLIRAEIQRLGVKDFLSEHMSMLAKKIVERAGEKGDNYIASTPEEKNHLFVAAAWAGVLTAFTAITKVLIGYVSFPLLFEGFFYFANYALGFLLMQRWHLALSSKQPAFTASALSRKFEDFMQTKELGDVTSEVKKIANSQFIASLANLLWVVPTVMALDWGYYLLSGQHLVSETYARTIISKHGLFTSGTAFYAAFTGVLLWMSSVASGWVENWIVFRNVPQMLSESSFLNSYLGKEKTRKFTASFAPMMGAAAGNLAIAFLLAFPLIFGKFTGLPLDIRHVTLAAGTITLGLNSLPWTWDIVPVVLSMMVSVAVMGVLNFGVSFYCSIRMAALARGVPPRYLKVIFKYAFRR